jgi:hypothetical protein
MPADSARIACSEQVAWAQRGAASVRALYADTGALSADASAIAGGDASGAVPQLEDGNSAISAFSGATGKC